MSPKTITCPDCGLRLTIERDKTGSRLKYDVNVWRNRCKRPHLDDPMLVPYCAQRDEPQTVDAEIHGRAARNLLLRQPQIEDIN